MPNHLKKPDFISQSSGAREKPHYPLSKDLERCRLLIDSGNLLRKKFRYEEAGRYYDQAVHTLRKIKGTAADRLFVDTVIQYARMYMDDPFSERAVAVIQEAMDRSKSLKDKNAQALLEMNLARSEWLRSRYQTAVKHFKKGGLLAKGTDDPKIQRSVMVYSQFYYYWLGRFREVIRSYETLVPDVEHFPNENLPLIAALTAGACFGYTGQISQGLGMLDAIRVHSRKIGNPYIAGLAGVTIGQLLLESNRLEESIRCVQDSLKETGSSHHLYAHLGGLAILSRAYYLIHDVKKSISLLREVIQLSRRAQMPMRHTPVILSLSWAIEAEKLSPIENLSLENEISAAIQGRNVFMKGVAYRYQALWGRRKNAPVREIIHALRRSVAFLQESGHQIELANAQVELAREYLRLGKKEQARQMADPAAKILFSINDSLIPEDIRPMAGNLRQGENLLKEILRLGQELVTIRDNRDLFRRIISTVNRITGAERGAIFLVKKDDPPDLNLRAAKNLTAEDIALPDFEASMKQIRETGQTGKGKIRNFNTQETICLPESSVIRSCISVPMTIRGKTVGVLYHDNRLFRSAFQETDLEILNYFANQAAIALDNAQAWEALQNLYEKQAREKQYFQEQYLESIHFEDIIGKSPAIMKVFHQVEQVAGTDATVLISGETGVGKEVIARSIHRHSTRRDAPFIRVNCCALPATLISSELFGHEKGAFTGALSRRIGRFELADGGTIFLDEIGDISSEIQVKLLRVIQNKEFERVGGHATLRSDFRLVAATNRDLQQAVHANRFRQDLYFRLNVFPLHVPPLRQRQEDIPILAQYFLKIHAEKSNKSVLRIAQKDMEKLMAYDWPGNVRELENIIERGVILSKGPDYQIPELDHHRIGSSSPVSSHTLEEVEKSHILKTLLKTGGKIRGSGGAAHILNIHPNTLYSRMKKIGIQKRIIPFSGDE